MLRSIGQAETPADNAGSLFSPGFKSVMAMAGWDEEAILMASLVVDDTPDRDLKQKKRPQLGLKTPPSNSRRKRRNQRRSSLVHAKILNLDEEEKVEKMHESVEEEKMGDGIGGNDEKVDKMIQKGSGRSLETSSSSKNDGTACMDKLREELSCAICLEICVEPSTTLCGHSFCRKCLRSATDKCGKKCPKCRQLIGNGRSCTVNTVLWNTIQLLFPKEIESRKRIAEVSSKKSPGSDKRRKSRIRDHNGHSPTFRAVRLSTRSPIFHPVRVSDRSRAGGFRAGNEAHDVTQNSESFRPARTALNRDAGGDRRRGVGIQEEDAALALRLQREEFMEAFRGENETSLPVATARANLRAMASRAMTLRVSRGR